MIETWKVKKLIVSIFVFYLMQKSRPMIVDLVVVDRLKHPNGLKSNAGDYIQVTR